MARALVFAPTTARRGDVIEIRALIAHPMESGQRTDAEGKLVPADIVKRVECRYDGAVIFAADFHPAIAANPVVSFHTVATVSGSIAVTWSGDRSFSQTETVTLTVT